MNGAAYWAHCVQEDPEAAIPHRFYALALKDSGDYAAAIPEYRRLLELDPVALGVRLELAKSLYAQGDRPGARTVLEEARALEPGNKAVAALWAELEASGQ